MSNLRFAPCDAHASFRLITREMALESLLILCPRYPRLTLLPSVSKGRCFWGCKADSLRSIKCSERELFDGLVSVVALTDFHQTGKMEFRSSFDLTRRNVVTTRFQTP